MYVSPSVRLSHAGILSKRLYNILKVFSPSGSNTILVFLYQTGRQYADPLTWASNAWGYEKKSRFSTYISLYLGNDARWSHSYYGRRIKKLQPSFQMVPVSMTLSDL